MKQHILESVLKRIEKVNEAKTLADYRPANSQELGVAMMHADRLGIEIEADNVHIDGTGWMIVSYVDSNDEEAQFRLAPQQYEIDEDEALQRVQEEEFVVESKWKVNDVVVTTAGPLQGVQHRVIAALDNDEYNIKPLVAPNKNPYRLGAAKAKGSQLKKWVPKTAAELNKERK